jgi:hypothetical protein
LRPGWKRIHALGLGLGGALRQRCAYDGCRAVPVRGSDRCRLHDQNWKKQRLKELRTGKGGKPMTPAESARLFRLDTQNLWNRAGPWLPMLTIWFGPKVELAFAGACHNAALPLPKLAPAIANNLRWAWVRTNLNHRDDPGWLRSLAQARKRQAKIGPPPLDYVYAPPPATAPTDSRIRAVLRRAAAWEPAAANPVVDRTTRASQRRQRLAPFKAPDDFAWREFLGAHWLTVFRPLFQAHRLNPTEADGELGRTLAVGWDAVLREQAKSGDGSVGPQQRRWHRLLRTLSQGGRPVITTPSPPARRPSPGRALVGAPDNDAWLAELCARTEAKRS